MILRVANSQNSEPARGSPVSISHCSMMTFGMLATCRNVSDFCGSFCSRLLFSMIGSQSCTRRTVILRSDASGKRCVVTSLMVRACLGAHRPRR